MPAEVCRMSGDRLKKLVLERLMQYYRFLSELTARRPIPSVTSAEIARALHIHATQVRKDFAAIGLSGIGHVGFLVDEACCVIRNVLGFTQKYQAVLVGTGHLGGVLLNYSGFARYGLHIAAVFETEEGAQERRIAGHAVRPIDALRPFIVKNGIPLAILVPPTDASQKLIEGLLSAGVKAIWNFTPTQLPSRAGIIVRNERHFSIGLSEIAYYLKQ